MLRHKRKDVCLISICRFWIPTFLVGVMCTVAGPCASAQTQLDPAVEARIDTLLAKLTLDQKLELIGGYKAFYTHAESSVGLPALRMADGPAGIRDPGPSTAYPTGIALAATFDTDLAFAEGSALGRDSRARGVSFLLGPGVNIYRAPMNGRNFEYFGEDPFLASRMAVNYINGVQKQGVSATVKHFALNNEEYDRHNIDSIVDERTLREIYLPAFEAAVKEAHAGAIMDSYNLVNGTHATQSKMLNIDIARKEWGFTGIIMSDWDATYDGVAAANSGLDLEMPSAKFMNPTALGAALADGRLTAASIDEKVRRLFRVAIQMGWLDHPLPQLTTKGFTRPEDPASRAVARTAALESITLLKNKGGLLPLNPSKLCTVAVIGPNGDTPVVSGGGSGLVVPIGAQSIVQALSAALPPSADCPAVKSRVLFSRGIPLNDEAKALAAKADVVVLALGFNPGNEGEGSDRTFTLPGSQNALIAQVAAVNPRTIVTVDAGGGFAMPWIDSVAALLHLWYPGEEGAPALTEILLGKANPEGHLPISIERAEADNPTHETYYPGTGSTPNHPRIKLTEGVFLGYRFYAGSAVKPLFPFGYGLSYTDFEFSNLRAENTAQGMIVSLDVKNVGQRAGGEAVQIYVSDPSATVKRPVEELKAFRKVHLESREATHLEFTLDRRAFSWWNPATHRWQLDPGKFVIMAGDSSEHLPLATDITIASKPAEVAHHSPSPICAPSKEDPSMNRKTGVLLAAALASTAGCSSLQGNTSTTSTVTKSAKRGIAYDVATAGDLQALSPGVSWWYNWASSPNSSTPVDYRSTYGMDFLPVLWNFNFNKSNAEAFIRSHPEIKYILVLNEPNVSGQATCGAGKQPYCSPADAAAAWPMYEAVAADTGVQIVGPQITYGTEPGYADPVVWMDAFIAAYKSANSGRAPRFDYLGYHWYDYGLSAQLDRLTKYGKPFWVTEFANWHGGNDGSQIDTLAKQQAQMTQMVSVCESRSDVVRYAWFTGRISPDPHYSSLLSASGQLSGLGQLYLSLPFTVAAPSSSKVSATQ